MCGVSGGRGRLETIAAGITVSVAGAAACVARCIASGAGENGTSAANRIAGSEGSTDAADSQSYKQQSHVHVHIHTHT